MRNFLLTASMLAGLNGLIGVRIRRVRSRLLNCPSLPQATAISSSAQRTLESLLPLSDPAGFHKNLNARIADLCPPGSKHAGIPFLPCHLTTLVQAEEVRALSCALRLAQARTTSVGVAILDRR